MAIMAIWFPICFCYNYTKKCVIPAYFFSHGQHFFAMARFFPWPSCFPMGKACFPWEKGFLPWESELQVLFIGIYNKDRESIISFN